MKTKLNKDKVILFVLESETKCSESIYFKHLGKYKKKDLKYDVIVFCIGIKFSENKILQIRNIKNVKKIILVKDNDIKEYTDENITLVINKIKKIFKNNKIKNFENICIERYGIPNKLTTFDSYLLAHLNREIFVKNIGSKNKVINYLKFFLGENFKGDEKKVAKVFTDEYLKNLKINIKNFDEQYNELINLLYKL